MLYDHVDLRVRDLASVRALYDASLPTMGFSRLEEDGRNVNYHCEREDMAQPFFGLMSDSGRRSNRTRIAFRVSPRCLR